MRTFFTQRHRRLMGLDAPADEPPLPPPNLPAACCALAVATRCTCEAVKWRCPEHGTRGQPCTALSHD